MNIDDFSWDVFSKTGRIEAYLIHKNTKEGGRCRNARNKGNRTDIKTDRVR